MPARLPTIYLPHGGGPWTVIDMGMAKDYAPLAAYLRGLGSALPERPRAVLCVSAHWESAKPTVMTSPRPPMLYDYYGFPAAAYEFEWPAPGSPEVAGLVRDRLEDAGLSAHSDPDRGFDHGTFVPLMLAYPEADVPTLQLSLIEGLDPARHLAVGRALAPLREEGVLIVGSGMSYHNMRGFHSAFRDPRARARLEQDSRSFDDWLAQTVDLEPTARETRLTRWETAPAARACHPREEHLLPLMVVAGAATDGRAGVPYRGAVLGAQVSAIHFE